MEHLRNNHNQLTIFVDSDAFVALAVAKDKSHESATSLLQALIDRSVRFVTSNYVFAETVTVISMLESHDAAIDFIANMQKPDSPVKITRADETLEDEAIKIFKQQTSKNISFIDCTNMAFFQQLQADAIFSFDHAYKTNRCITVQGLLAEEAKEQAES